MVLLTDRLLAEFFRYLDQHVGTGAWVMAMSADHGVAPTPESLTEKHLDGGRVKASDIGPVVEKALRDAYHTPPTRKWCWPKICPTSI